MKRYIALLLVAATVFSLLGGCSIVNTPTEPYEEPSEEEIFTKTIYDFEGLRVDSLDGQEDTNFIVYAKGVKEISVTGQTNVLVATDYENLSYTFANPDETLLSMKKGDTFFASVSEHCPEGVTVKVKDMVTSGNQLTVYSEPLGFADLFTYIDIFMDVPLDQVMPISGTNAPGSSASSSGSAPGENSESNVITTPVNQTFSDCAEFSAGGAKISHQTYVTLQYVTVALRYSREHSKVSCTVYADTIYGGQLDIEGEWAPDEWIIPLAVIPLRVAGIIAVPVELNAVISGGGKTSSHIEFKESKRLGFTASVSKQNSSYQAINEVLLPGTFENSYFGETEAELNFAMEVKPTLSAGFLGQFYASCRPGFGFYAHMAPLVEVSADKEDSSIHDCKVCIDGDINWFLDLSIGFEVKLAEKLDRKTIGDAAADILDENREQLDGQTLSVPLHFGGKVADFYVTMQDNHWVFGWGKCNNNRYKTTVTLTDSSSGAAAGAIVTAFYPDGRQEEATADSAGVAVLYLPTGESTLSGSYGKESGSGTVQVEDAPTEAELSLRENQLFVRIDFTIDGEPSSSSAYSLIQDSVLAQYPDAIFLPSNAEPTVNPDAYNIQTDDVLIFIDCFTHHLFHGSLFYPEINPVYTEPYSIYIDVRKFAEFGIPIGLELAYYGRYSKICEQIHDENDTPIVHRDYIDNYHTEAVMNLVFFEKKEDGWDYRCEPVREEIIPDSRYNGLNVVDYARDIDIYAKKFPTYFQWIIPYVDLFLRDQWHLVNSLTVENAE